jgi:Fe2+ transport system protein FeoA
MSKDGSEGHRESGCADPMACPLSRIRAGVSVRIKELTTPPAMSQRLREMGFYEDRQIKILTQNTNIICQVCNVRLGISDDLADRIMVEPLTKRGHTS